MLACLLLTLIAVDRQKLGLWLIAGLAWGATSLIRPHAAPMAALISIYIFFTFGWRQSALLALGVLLCLSPWVIRNYIQLGSPVLFATESGETLLGSNNRYVLDDPNFHGMWISPMQVPEYIEHLKPIQNEIARDKEQRRMGMDFLKQNPREIPRLVTYKLWRWLTPITNSGGKNRLIVLGSYGVLLVLLFAGIAMRLYKTSPALWVIVLCSIAMVAITAVYWGNLTRGRLPLEMLWLPWGAYSVTVIWGKLREWVMPHISGKLVSKGA